MIPFPPKSPKPRLVREQSLSLAELDVWLDVEVDEFDRAVTRLVKEFRTKQVSVDIPTGEAQIAADPVDGRVSWGRLYQAQIRRLARMGRADEFLMARRYDFFKARGQAALRECGYPEEELAELLRRGRAHLPEPPVNAKPAARANLDRAMTELEALRNHYVEGALYMVEACAHRYRNLGVDFADLIQEGSSSLFQAVEGFDWRRDVRFKTYAQYWVHQAVLKALYNSSRTVRVPIWVQKALSKIQKIREKGRGADGSAPTSREVGDQLGFAEERVDELLKTKRYAVSLDAEMTGEDGASLGNLLADRRDVPIPEAIDDGSLGDCLDEVMADLPSREHMILTRRYGLHGRQPETLGEIATDLGDHRRARSPAPERCDWPAAKADQAAAPAQL